ncbi:MAG: hypothetical protein HYV26_15810 [Candidatus Hydrogenedentes bacterium]|nr:hypothetical protein [Candidatus Hydrogenedentota bacterium]
MFYNWVRTKLGRGRIMETEAVNPYALEYLAPFLLTAVTLILAVSFVLWLVVFLLDMITDTSRRGYRERRWSLTQNLVFGGTLLGVVILLLVLQFSVFYTPYSPSEFIPKL